MSTDTDQSYCQWSHLYPELSAERSESLATSISQMLDHGSISFGKFAVESLSWERWSVFSHNRCQEELEKFKAPGLVAQKKAYFEEYYKKIRALKALQVEVQANHDPCQDGSFYRQTDEDKQITVQPENKVAVTRQIEHGTDDTTHLVNSVNITTSAPMNSGDVLQTDLLEIDLMTSGLNSSEGSSKDERKEDSEKEKDGRIEDTEQETNDFSNHDDRTITKDELKAFVSTVGLEASVGGTTQNLPVSTVSHSEAASNKVKLDVNKQEDYIPAPKAKEAAASTRNKAKLACRTKVDSVKPSEHSRYPSQKVVIGRAEISSNAITNRVASNIRSTSVSSHGPLIEVRSNVTVLRTSLPMDGRATSSSINKHGAEKGHLNFKVSANRLPSRLLVQTRGLSCAQSTSKETAVIGGMRDLTLKNKRTHDVQGKSLDLGSRHMIPKGRAAEAQRPKAMGEIGPQSNPREGKKKAGNGETERRGFGSSNFASSMLRSSHQAQTTKLELKKTVLARSTDQTLDRGKPRRGIPSWR